MAIIAFATTALGITLAALGGRGGVLVQPAAAVDAVYLKE